MAKLLAILLMAWAGQVAAVDDTIRLSDLPKDAPRFTDYPAAPFKGRNAAADLKTDPRSRAYRTQLKRWSAQRPNFAGHYILATWNCGAGCVELAIIDAASGRVFHPEALRKLIVLDVDDELLEDVEGTKRNDFGAMHYRVDSKLVEAVGTPNGRTAERGMSYYVWDRDELKRIRVAPKTSEAAR